MFLPKELGAQKMVCGNMETETSMSSLDQLYDEHPEKVKYLDKFLSWLFLTFSKFFCFIVTSVSESRIQIRIQALPLVRYTKS